MAGEQVLHVGEQPADSKSATACVNAADSGEEPLFTKAEHPHSSVTSAAHSP